MKKKLIASITCLCMLLVMLLSSTLAWFTDQQFTESTMTVGKISIKQTVSDDESLAFINPGVLIDYDVAVENTGNQSAYLRTIFAFEDGTYTDKQGESRNVLEQITLSNGNIIIPGVGTNSGNKIQFAATKGGKTTLYTVGYYIHAGELKSEAGSDTVAILDFFKLKDTADQKWGDAVNGKYDILVLSQACQVAGMDGFSAAGALDRSFGTITSVKCASWFGDMMQANTEAKIATAEELQEAINNGQTNIVLENNIELTDSIVIPAAAATFAMRSAPAPVVLNLNGKTITTAYNEETQKHQYAINNYGNLVINGGTIEARGIYNQDGATLTVNGTKIVNLDTNGGSCIWSYGGSVILNNATLIGYTGCVYSDGYLEINGGTYTCYSGILDDGTQVGPTYTIRSNGELVINGGDFTSRHGLVAVKGNATINGGTYTMNSIGAITSHVIYAWGNDAKVTVNGGTFNCDLRTAQANGSSMICVNASNVTVGVNGGTFNHKSFEKYVADGFKAFQTPNGFKVMSAELEGVIYNADQLATAAANGGEYVLVANIDMDADATITVANGVTVVLDLNGKTIAGVADGTGNREMFLVKGNLTVKNGTLTMDDEVNQGWGAMSAIFDITAGGVVTLENVVAENKGGTDMNFVAHLNNWGTATLNVNNSTLKATYVAVRVFNSGYDMNTVTIKNSTLSTTGNAAFWVHNYTAADFGTQEKADAQAELLNFTFENVTFEAKKAAFRYGMTNSEYYTADGALVVSTAAALQSALDNGVAKIALGANLAVTGDNMFTVPTGAAVAIDLNGHNISADFAAKIDGASAVFTINKNASLTIEGEGNVHVVAAPTLSYVSSVFTNLGSLTINGGNYSMDYGTYAEGYLIPTIVDTNSNVGKATTVINGGTFTHTRNMFRNFAQAQRGANNATLIINGGTFMGQADDYATIWNQKTSSNGVEGDGIVTINGGDFQYMDICNDFATGVTIAEGLNIAVQS